MEYEFEFLMDDKYQKGDLVFEDNNKKFYLCDRDDLYLMRFLETIRDDNGREQMIIGKSMSCRNTSKVLFELLEKNGIKTHFADTFDSSYLAVKKTELFEGYAVVRNIASWQYAEQTGLKEGEELKEAVFETYIEASDEEKAEIKKIALKANEILKEFLKDKFIKLVDMRLKFGKIGNDIVICDEISCDNCRMWDLLTDIKLDRDRFIFDLGGIDESYLDVSQRITKSLTDYLTKEEKEYFGI